MNFELTPTTGTQFEDCAEYAITYTWNESEQENLPSARTNSFSFRNCAYCVGKTYDNACRGIGRTPWNPQGNPSSPWHFPDDPAACISLINPVAFGWTVVSCLWRSCPLYPGRQIYRPANNYAGPQIPGLQPRYIPSYHTVAFR